MSVTYAPNARSIAIDNINARIYFSSPSLATSSRYLYVIGGIDELHVQGTDSIRLQYSPSTHSLALNDPAGNATNFSATGQISASQLFTNGNVTASSANIGGLLTANEIIVNGDLTVNGLLVKSAGMFKIDHPQDPMKKYLIHSFVESPDMMNVYNGNIVTDEEGFATVRLPDYFEVLNIDFRYQLTALGQFAQAIIKDKVYDNRFVIQTDKPNVEVSWQVTGIRNDDYARENRIQVEVDKTGEEINTRLYTPREFTVLNN